MVHLLVRMEAQPPGDRPYSAWLLPRGDDSCAMSCPKKTAVADSGWLVPGSPVFCMVKWAPVAKHESQLHLDHAFTEKQKHDSVNLRSGRLPRILFGWWRDVKRWWHPSSLWPVGLEFLLTLNSDTFSVLWILGIPRKTTEATGQTWQWDTHTHVSWTTNQNHLPGVPIQGKLLINPVMRRRLKFQACHGIGLILFVCASCIWVFGTFRPVPCTAKQNN